MKHIDPSELRDKLEAFGAKLSDEPVTYRCHHCHDLGMVLRLGGHELIGADRTTLFTSPCRCKKGEQMARGDEVYNAKNSVELPVPAAFAQN